MAGPRPQPARRRSRDPGGDTPGAPRVSPPQLHDRPEEGDDQPAPGRAEDSGTVSAYSSPTTQRSMMCRAMETAGGSARGPAPERSSSRVNQRASSISVGSSRSVGSPSTRAG